MDDGPAPAFFIITGKIGDLQFERLLDSSSAGIDLDQKLAWINVRGSLDLGGGPFAGAHLDSLGSRKFKMKGVCKVVPMNRVDRVKVEADMELSPSLVH